MITCPGCGTTQAQSGSCITCGKALPANLEPNPYATSSPVAESSYESSASVATGRVHRKCLASLGSRFVAAFVDGLINFAGAAPGFVLLFMNAETMEQNDEEFFLFLGAIYAGLLLVNIVQWYFITRDGQSLGKKCVGIRIVNHDTGRLPGFGKGVAVRIWVNGLIGMMPFIGGFYSLIDILLIFGQDRRCIHDMIAGTSVIDDKLMHLYGKAPVDSTQFPESIAATMQNFDQ